MQQPHGICSHTLVLGNVPSIYTVEVQRRAFCLLFFFFFNIKGIYPSQEVLKISVAGFCLLLLPFSTIFHCYSTAQLIGYAKL